MKKIIFLVSFVVLLLFIVGCSPAEDPDVPPLPPSIEDVGESGALAGQAYSNSGACYSDSQLQIYFSDADMVVVNTTNRQWSYEVGPLYLNETGSYNSLLTNYQYVYSIGYLLKNCEQWEEMRYQPINQGEFLGSSNWIWSKRGVSSTTLANSTFRLSNSFSREGPHYIATYGCNRVDGQWDCNNGKWVITPFMVEEGPTCFDNVKNQFESDVDCGGSCRTNCTGGQSCNNNSDCASNVCEDLDRDGTKECFDLEVADISLTTCKGKAITDSYTIGSSLTGDSSYALELFKESQRLSVAMFDGDGNRILLPVAYANSKFNVTMGEEGDGKSHGSDKQLKLLESGREFSYWDTRSDVYKNDYFVITSGIASDGSAKSYLFQYMGADAQTKTNPLIKFKNIGSGETLEYPVTPLTATGTVATIVVGGNSFIVQNATQMGVDDFAVDVDLNGDGIISKGRNGNVNFVDNYGSEWQINYSDASGILNQNSQSYVQIDVGFPNINLYGGQVPENFTLNITAVSGPQIEVCLLTEPGLRSGDR